VDVCEPAAFYHGFRVVEEIPQRPVRRIRVCTGLPCLMAGARGLLSTVRTSAPDALVEETGCLGHCDGAPAVLTEGRELAPATPEAVRRVAEGAPELPEYRDLDAYRARGGYVLLEALRRGDPGREAILNALEGAGLRGLGGAGFPTAAKWRAVKSQPGPRHVVVNADESEPGAFKDRHCLERDPHRVLEGAFIAARVIGARDVHVYLRDEYPAARSILSRELAALNRWATGRLPRVHLHRGAGAYICGEESALLESIEGRRPLPRLRPPYVAERGLQDQPTLVQNVETLYRVTGTLAARFGPAGIADEHAAGRRFFCLSGRVTRPGVYEAPRGVSLRTLIEEHAGGMPAGHTLRAFLPCGASGGILPATLADQSLEFGSLEAEGAFIGSASVIVLSQADAPREAAAWALDFLARESCGKCTPCRLGTRQARNQLQGRGGGEALRGLAEVLAEGSICGLGQSAANPLRTLERHFGDG